MTDSDNYARQELDPFEWSQVLDDTSPTGSRFIFQRTIEVAFELSQSMVRGDQRWLDVGCGTGHLAHRLRAAGADVVGVDRDPAMLEFARRRWLSNPAHRKSGKLVWIRASAEQLPLRDASIDGLVTTSLMGYLPSPRVFFAEIHRVLRSEGYAIITFTNRSSWLLKINYLVSRWTRSGSNSERSLRLHQTISVVNELGDLGFTIVQVRFYNFVLHARRWLLPPSPMAKRVEQFGRYGFSHWLGRNFIIVARKAVE